MVWSLPGLTLRSSIRGGNTLSVAIHPRGDLLAAAGRKVELWSLASNRLVASFPIPVPNAQVEFSADGKYLLAVARDQVAQPGPSAGHLKNCTWMGTSVACRRSPSVPTAGGWRPSPRTLL